MEQIMERRVAKMRAEMKVDIRTRSLRPFEVLVSQMNIHHAEKENREELAIMQAGQEKIEAMMEARLEKAKTNPEKTKAGLEEISAAMDVFEGWTKWTPRNLEIILKKSEAVAVHQEVPNEETAVETIGALEDRFGDRHLDEGAPLTAKRRPQSDGAPGKFGRRPQTEDRP
jgi:hypothetical protein